jgi:adenylylsulfate kinase
VVFFTGLPGSGKTELAYAVERLLFDRSRVGLVVDPNDAVSLSSAADGRPAPEPSAGVLELARRAADAGFIVLLSFAAPHASLRDEWRAALGSERFIEVSVSTPLEACKARSEGDIHTGQFYRSRPSPEYEAPTAPAAFVDQSVQTSESAAQNLLELLEQRGFLKAP